MKKPKTCGKLKNWRAYNESPVNRGALTLWFEDPQIESRHQPERSGYRGSPMTYSDVAIQCGLTIPVAVADNLRLPEAVRIRQSAFLRLRFANRRNAG
ncbi:transposase [Methylomicrobium album]|uniref:transposase n=1 Tax=Methylomicrobium album TaxID=39775 RepID=UPI001BC86E6C